MEARERISLRRRQLETALSKGIVLMDGAMGTMVQRHRLEEKDFRGKRFEIHGKDLKGNNDILAITRPDVIGGIHRAYLDAGLESLKPTRLMRRRFPRRTTALNRPFGRSIWPQPNLPGR